MYWRDRIKSDKDTIGFLVRGLLILLPVIMLVGFGLYSLKKDRLWAYRQASEEAEMWLRRLVENEIPSIFDLPYVRFDRPSNEWFDELDLDENPFYANRSKASIWLLNAQGDLVFPPRRNDFPDPASTEDLELWNQYRVAKEWMNHTNAQKGADLLADIMTSQKDGVTPSGHRVAPLAAVDWLSWNKTNAVSSAFTRQALFVLGSDLLKRPSSFSHRLFEEAGEFLSVTEMEQYAAIKSMSDHFESLRRNFQDLELSEMVTNSSVLPFEKGRFQSEHLMVTLPFEDTAEMGNKMVIGWHGNMISNRISQMLQKGSPAPYLKMHAYVGGQWIPKHPDSNSLSSTNIPPFDGRPQIILQAKLESPDLLYKRQRQRTRLFGLMIGLAALTVLVGWLTEWKAFLRQKRLNEMKTNFVSSVSHELRTPLASVRLMAEELADLGDTPKDKARTYHGYMARECVRLSGIIENVLNFSRIEKGTQHYEKTPTDMVSCARETLELLERYANERRVRLRFQSSVNKVVCFVDARSMRQVLVNLIDNAIKHSPEDGEVLVELKLDLVDSTQLSNDSDTPHPNLHIAVVDHGNGIPENDRSRVFDAFFRSGSELRRETQGVGLGLAIVKHIVEAHNGKVELESPPVGGCCFVLSLPILEKGEDYHPLHNA